MLFSPSAATSESVSVQPPDTSLETSNPRGLKVGLEEGNLAPDFEFSAYDGTRQRLSDYRGRAVFLNFWATWCGPCRVELVDMETMLREFGAQDLAVLAINNGESFSRGDTFIKDLGVELSAFAYDPDTAIVQLFGVRGMPTSYFIDREGVITLARDGQVSPRSMRANIDAALAGHKAR